MTKRREVSMKMFMVVVFVPTTVEALNAIVLRWTSYPALAIANFALGLILSYLILTVYDRVFLKKNVKLRETIKENKEDIDQVRFELEEIKTVLSEEGLIDTNELEVTASVKKGVTNEIEEERQFNENLRQQ